MFRVIGTQRSLSYAKYALRVPCVLNVRHISHFVEWPVSPVKVNSWADDYLKAERIDRVTMQQQLLTFDPHFDVTEKMLKSSKSGLKLAMTLRADIGFCKKNSSKGSGNSQKLDLVPLWKSLDEFLKGWLGVVFSESMLELRQIKMEGTSGEVLEYIANTEAVHPVTSVQDMKHRFDNGRRCYALFHSSQAYALPLAYIHVGLMADYAPSLE